MDKLALVRDFWNENPCDGQQSYVQRAQFRYNKDPWMPGVLHRISSRHRQILEVGCGQGTDAVTLCRFLAPGSEYVGVDISEASLANARRAAAEMAGHLNAEPRFAIDNGERLGFADATFDAVVSVGVLHHSPDTKRAVGEVHRVLKPGGVAYVFLYRTLSPKVLACHTLRGVQRFVDGVLSTDRILYQAARRARLNGDVVGTMIYECFGVPILRSYTRAGMRNLFADFSALRLTAYSVGLPPAAALAALDRMRSNPLGYLWLAEATK
jgi:SAM-dependent methyltransferase